VQSQQLVLLGAPALAGPHGARCGPDRQSQRARPAADPLGRPAERLRDRDRGVQRRQAAQAPVVRARPAPAVGGQPQLAGARGDGARRAAREVVGDAPARQAVRIAVAHGGVLAGRPAMAPGGAVHAERPCAGPHGAGVTREAERQLVDSPAGLPALPQQGVLGGRVAARCRPGGAEPAPARADLVGRAAQALRQRGGRDAGRQRRAHEPVLELGPGARPAARRDAEQRAPRDERIGGAIQPPGDLGERHAGGVLAAQLRILRARPPARRVR
jgi:hypothetical protein